MSGVNGSDKAGPGVPAIHRAIAVLDLIAGRRDPQPLHTISRALSIPRSSALGICRTLVAEDVLRQDGDGRYLIGPRLVRLARQNVGELDLASAFSRVLESLGELRWTVQLAVRTGREVVYIARRDGTQPLSLASAAGRPLPASTTAVGKAMLIRASDAELAELYPRDELFPSLTPRSVTSLEGLKGELDSARERGYTTDQGETMLGVMAAGAPVFLGGGAAPVAAISVTTIGAMGDESFVPLAALANDVARSMSRLLGA